MDVLVGTDTGGFEGFRRKLLVLIGDHVDAQREVVHAGLLTTQVEDTDLRVGNTTVEPGLRVGLHEIACHVSICRLFLHRQIPFQLIYFLPHIGSFIFIRRGFRFAIITKQASRQYRFSHREFLCWLLPSFTQTLRSSRFSQPKRQNPQIDKKHHTALSTHLVLAVAVASRGTTSHFVGYKMD